MPDKLIPSNDSDFNQFQEQFIAAVSADPAKHGLYDDEVTALTTAQTEWAANFTAHQQAQEAARTATQAKEGARTSLESLIRAAGKKINATAGVDNATRVAAGMPTRSTTRSHVGAPTSRPVGRIEQGGPNTLLVDFVDENSPHKTAKPKGVHACEVWAHIGDPAPTDASAFTFLGLATRTPYIDRHSATDAGKSIYYLLRWQNSKGAAGPWGVVVFSKIPA
jgi:hypothetical protein